MTSIAEPSSTALIWRPGRKASTTEDPPPSSRGSSRSQAERARLAAMVREHLDSVWRLALRLGVRNGDADDVVQRVFLTASRRVQRIQAGKERAFLMAVAAREASHVRRSYRRRAEVSQEAIGDKSTGRPRPDELVGNRQALEYVSALIDELEDDLRVVFVLFEVEEMSSEQIAEVLCIPTGTVKSRLRRARARFAALTAAHGCAPDTTPQATDGSPR